MMSPVEASASAKQKKSQAGLNNNQKKKKSVWWKSLTSSSERPTEDAKITTKEETLAPPSPQTPPFFRIADGGAGEEETAASNALYNRANYEFPVKAMEQQQQQQRNKLLGLSSGRREDRRQKSLERGGKGLASGTTGRTRGKDDEKVVNEYNEYSPEQDFFTPYSISTATASELTGFESLRTNGQTNPGEVSLSVAQLQRQKETEDLRQETQLDAIHQDVTVLKTTATAMNDEVTTQNLVIDDIGETSENAEAIVRKRAEKARKIRKNQIHNRALYVVIIVLIVALILVWVLVPGK